MRFTAEHLLADCDVRALQSVAAQLHASLVLFHVCHA